MLGIVFFLKRDSIYYLKSISLYENICWSIQLRKKDPKKINSKKIIGSLQLINQQLKIFYELYYNYDKEKLVNLFELNKSFLDKLRLG